MHGDPLADFRLRSLHGQLHLEAGPTLPASAADYLRNYIAKTRRYANISRDPGQILFSLYQPVMNSPAGERALSMRLRRKFRRERLPQAATIGITSGCQCHCTHCSAEYHMNSGERGLSDAELGQAIEQAVDLGATTIILLGGEPLLRRTMEGILSYVDQERARAVAFTNGEFLSQQRARSLRAAGLSGLFFSVDSADPTTHDALRGRPGLFHRLVESVGHAKEAGMAVALSSYLTTERMENGVFEEMMELGRELGVNEVTFFDAIPVGRMIDPKDRQDSEAPRVDGQKADDAHTYLDLSARRLIEQLTRAYRRLPDYPAITPQSMLTSEIGSSFCFAANTQFYLSSSGHMSPCDFTPLSAGRFPEKDIATLWNDMIRSPFYRRRSRTCRMQDPDFRARTVGRIPENASLPYPLALLEEAEDSGADAERTLHHSMSET